MEKFKGKFLYPLNDRDVLVKYDLSTGRAPLIEVGDVEFNAIPATVPLEELKPGDAVEIQLAVMRDAYCK